jgi:membrane-associated protease RseP (regulator of RpoE activity)
LIVQRGPPGWSSGAARLADGDAAVTVTLSRPSRSCLALGFWFDAERLDAVVASVVPGAASPLAVGDRVVAVDGQPVDGLYQGAIYWLLAGRPTAIRVPVTVERGGVRLSTSSRSRRRVGSVAPAAAAEVEPDLDLGRVGAMSTSSTALRPLAASTTLTPPRGTARGPPANRPSGWCSRRRQARWHRRSR